MYSLMLFSAFIKNIKFLLFITKTNLKSWTFQIFNVFQKKFFGDLVNTHDAFPLSNAVE